MPSLIHIDADAFFASVEQASDPRLRGLPVAVGGEKRGIIASASYEARQFGIFTPMPTVRARKLCPRLVVLPGDYEKYERFSRWMFSYAYDFTPDVEIGSIDEGYCDLTGARRPAVEIAATIRDAIRQALKITVSEGIGTNKLVSQVASKLNKPAAFRHVPPGQEMAFLHPLPNRWLPGVGPHTSVRLNAAGLTHIRQVADTPVDMLALLVGERALQLRQFANGVDERPVVPASEPAKSYGQQETFAQDQTDESFLEAVLRRMADNLFAKVRADGKSVRTLTVKVRYNDMDEDQCAESLMEPTDLETEVYGRLQAMLQRAWRRRVSLRLVSLRLSNLYDTFFRDELALDRGARQHEARRRLATAVDALREEHGRYVIMRGHDLTLRMDRVAPPAAGGGASPKPRAQERRAAERAAPPQARGQEVTRGLQPAPPLAVRSHYSFLDSTLSPAAIVGLAQRAGLRAVALCDTGNLHGAVEFTAAARAAGLKPILGAEISVHGRPLHLYVQNATGYHNLCRLLSREDRSSQIGDRRSKIEVRRSKFADRRSETGDRGSKFGDWSGGALPLRGSLDGLLAVSPDASLGERFPGRFYLGVAHPEELRRLVNPDHVPVVALLPVHYAEPADRWKFDILQSVRTLTLLRQAHPQKRAGGAFHFRSSAEVAEIFRQHPDLLARVHDLVDRCTFELPMNLPPVSKPGRSGGACPAIQPQFPAYPCPGGSSGREFLRRLVFEGLARRYPSQEGIGAVRDRVETELEIIHDVGYEDYFLITWDILQACRERGIDWITRGSAADSLVCYCLGISDVCPIRFDLYFRRFLNKERMALNKLPDIDIDFPHDRKDDVVDLIFEKYGTEHCAVVGGFSTFQARSAFAEVAKVLGVAERDVRRFTEHFPWGFGGPSDPLPGAGPPLDDNRPSLVDMLRSAPETRDLPLDEEPYRSALAMASFLDGVPRYAKMHPCGVVLSRQPMHELTPTFRSGKGWPATHFDMDAVEAIGLVKMDILAQGGLAAMRDVKSMLERRGVSIDLSRCQVVDPGAGERRVEGAAGGASVPASQPGDSPHLLTFDDPAVWGMISGGGARAVHHIESPAMTGLCRMCGVQDIDTLIAIVSVIRPGAANEDKKREFTRRYQGLSPVTYPHPSLEPCLRSTFGLVVYEEHILQICEAFAGLGGGRADVLRRALVKEKWGTVTEIGREFVALARGRGHSDADIRRVWEAVTGFHGYAFCKAHSTAYGVEAWQSAWLKCYFPAEFMAAVLSNGKGFYAPLVYVLETWRLGIAMQPPWVNEPGPAFEAVPSPNGKRQRNRSGRSIRVPATYVKTVTERTRERLLEERARGAFASLASFFLRVQPTREEMEALSRVGAFDGFGQSRCAQFWEIQQLFARWGDQRAPGQGWLFDQATPGGGNGSAAPALPPIVTEPTRLQRLQWESELLGFPAGGHPLELYPDVAWETYCPVKRLAEFPGQEVTVCGLVIEDRVHHQVNGEPMKFLTLCDWTGMIETELFARTYRNYGLTTVRYPVLEVEGRVEPFENGHGVTLRVLRAGPPRKAMGSRLHF
jgi:DNA-directed DNA polymerase III PolC